jgi:ABC-type polysaccharide/polyol phosphate export permease
MTPIIYPIAMIPEKIKQILFLNPMARIIIDSRAVLIYDTIPTLRHNLITIAIIVVFLIIGILVFKMRSAKFAEEI